MNLVDHLVLASVAFAACLCLALGYPALVPALDRQASRAKRLYDELGQYDKTGREILGQSFAAAGALFCCGLVLGGPILAVLAAGGGYFAPGYLLAQKVKARQEKLHEQLVDAMETIVNSLRSGQTLIQGIGEACREKALPKPISEEFEIMTREYALGATQDEVLEHAKARFKSKDFNLVCSAISISLDRGGDLTSVLERTAAFMRELARLRENIHIKTAGARTTAKVMRFVPLFILAVLYVVEPKGVALLFQSLLGNVLVTIAILLNVASYIWTQSILESEF